MDDCRTIDDNGKPYPPSELVYTNISQLMQERGCKITAKHVYVIVRENRNGYRNLLEQHYNIDPDCQFDKQNNTSLSDNTLNASTSSTSLHSKEFQLILSAEKWLSISPVKKIYNDRAYWVLKTGWTDIIAEKLWQQQKLDCVLKFKKHNVYSRTEARCYVSVKGSCVECAANIECTMYKQPENDTDAIFHCNVGSICSAKHSNKKQRQLKGKRRIEVADKLIQQRKDAITFRREEAQRLKEFGDKNPPILPSSAVLRKAKEERLLKQHGLVFSNPVLNLLNSAKEGKYVGSIISISLFPFYCIYWTPEQLLLYTSRCKKDPEAFLTLDATGGVVKRESSQDSPIFLYQCVFVTKDGSVPVFQMVSADHRAMMIAFFLRNIIAKNVPVPRTVVTDFGWAILIAVSNVFARCHDFRDYLQKCYMTAVMGNIDMMPPCYIRLDVSHLIHMVARWKSLKSKDKMLVRKFTLRCISQAYQMDSLKKLEYFIESMLSVALSKYIGCTINGQQLMSDKRMQYLNNIIKGYINIDTVEATINDNDDIDEEATSFINDNDEDKGNCDASDWLQWSNLLWDSAQKIAEDSEDGSIFNACYNPEFAKQIKTQLLPYLPVWTGVMRPYFQRSGQIATSSSVEAEFCDLKNRCFKGQLPMRVDKFVIQHMNFLDAKIMLASNERDVLLKQNASLQEKHVEKIMPDNVTPVKTYEVAAEEEQRSEENNWSTVENWHGLTGSKETSDICSQELPVSAPKKRKQPSYLDKCAEWDYIKNMKSHNLPLMINGNKCKAVNMKRGLILNVQETCAFDSILQIVASAIATHTAYGDAVRSSSDSIFHLAANILEYGKLLSTHYTERATILQDVPILKDKITIYTRNIMRLNANCNVAHLAEYVLKNEPSYNFSPAIAVSRICANQ